MIRLPRLIPEEPKNPGEIIISYQAKAVVVVVAPGSEGPQEFEVLQDGRPLNTIDPDLDTIREGERTIVRCDYPRLYKFVSNPEQERHVLILRTKSRGICFYPLSFINAAIGNR